MSYTVVSNTTTEAASGAAFMPARLGELLERHLIEFTHARHRAAQRCKVEIYSLVRFEHEEECDSLVERFGGDPMSFMFLNECAVRACAHFNMPIVALGTIDEVPPGSSLMLMHLFVT